MATIKRTMQDLRNDMDAFDALPAPIRKRINFSRTSFHVGQVSETFETMSQVLSHDQAVAFVLRVMTDTEKSTGVEAV